MTVMTPFAPKTNVPTPGQLAKRFAGVTVEEREVSPAPTAVLAFVTETESDPVKPTIGKPVLDKNGAVAYVNGSGVRVRIGASTNSRENLVGLRSTARRWKGLSPAITAYLKANPA